MPSVLHLSTNQRTVLTDLLLVRQATLELGRAEELQGQSRAEAARETLLQDADDVSQRASAHEVEAVVSALAGDEYNAISNALLRIAGGDYGVCIDCQAAIPFERLRIEPHTLRCTSCQTLHEPGTTP